MAVNSLAVWHSHLGRHARWVLGVSLVGKKNATAAATTGVTGTSNKEESVSRMGL